MVNFLIMKTNRRKFLGNLAIGSSALAALPIISAFRKKEDKKEMNKEVIKSIKPLGFVWETKDPFLFCVHHEDKYPKGDENMAPDKKELEGRHIGQDFVVKDGWRMYHGSTIPGFPGHPHRGFETITVVREGIVDHADSTGAAGRYGNGDVQWMTAGKGVQHSEMFPLVNSDKENPMELFQIWLNLPKKNKMVEPHFAMLWEDTIPKYKSDDENVFIEVIAGNVENKNAPTPPPNSWANDKENDVAVLNIHLKPNTTYKLDKTKEGHNRTVYYYEGNGLKIGDKTIAHYHAVEVEPDMDISFQNGNEDAKILILQGKPIDEPVVQHGPFVMNTREEINQAFKDYQETRYGGWPWEKYDQVHDKNKGRFALHSDGTEELKDI